MKKNTRRSLTREFAMQCLFNMEIQGDFIDINEDSYKEKLLSLREEEPFPLDEEYLNSVITSVITNREEIDKIISSKATNWKIGRISKVDLSILRLSIAEMLFMEGIPHSASINEAVELAKKFGSEDSRKFINGVLGKVVTEG